MNKQGFFLLLIILITVSILVGYSNKKEREQGGEDLSLEQLQLPKEGEEIVVINTNYGTIKIRLFPEVAPKAVENFKTHAKNGYYNGVIFHRVINEFMIQGGDPSGNGTGGESIWGEPFEDEFHVNYHHIRGALSMANSGANTNGSQFFIVQKTEVEKPLIAQMAKLGEENGYPEEVVKAYEKLGGTPHLDFRHTVFGQVFEGMDIVDKIAKVETDEKDKPIESVVIESMEVVIYK